jgi:hypothetical protein
LPDWRTWPVTATDGTTTTRQFTEQVIDPLTGEAANRTRTVIELATGLNYQDASGTWQESQDAIALTPGGGAAALEGPLQVQFSPKGLNDDEAITITTPKGQLLNARVQGVYYFDSQSGQSQLLAAPSDTAAAERLSPNQIIYRNAFFSDVFQADLRYTYTKAGYESDLIVTRQPKLTPEGCGFNPATTLLQVRHEWRHAPLPAAIQTMTVGYGNTALQDQFIDLGEVLFPPGSAVLADTSSPAGTNAPAPLGSASLPGAGAPIGKEWRQGGGAGGSDLLIESVSWPAIVTNLVQLPLMSSVEGAPWTDYLADAGAGGIDVSGRAPPVPVLVLDYTAISGGTITNCAFASYSEPNGPTYVVTGATYVYGTVTFQANCVIKFADWSRLTVYGSVVCNGDPNDPSVLTSWTDNQYGQVITGLSGLDQTMLYLYPLTPGNITLNALAFRNANVALSCQGPCSCGGACYVATLSNCSLYQCSYGLVLYGMSASIVNSATNSVGTAILENPGCTYNNTGTFGAGYPPASVTLSPLSVTMPQGGSVTFRATMSATTAPTYQWLAKGGTFGPLFQQIADGPTSALFVGNPGDGTQIEVVGGNPFGATDCSTNAGISVLDSSSWTAWQSVTNSTNGATPSVWQTNTLGPPLELKWNTKSILYGRGRFTAISQLNSWDTGGNNPPGVIPVTALTGIHGYTRGHGMGPTITNTPQQVPWTVYFCLPPTNVVTADVIASITHDGTNGPDYTLLLFDHDITQNGITPMLVGTPPQGDFVELATDAQTWPGGTGVPGDIALLSPVPPSSPLVPMPLPFLPWNLVKGDSGSPNMVLNAANNLVFYGGTTTSQMSQITPGLQNDMDYLSAWGGYTPSNYKMTWYQGPW